MCRLLIGLVIVAAVIGASPGAGPVAAQADCALEPVSLPLFDGTPVADIPGALATPASPDDGSTPATEADVATFTAAIDVLLPCINNADKAVSFSVFTDRYLAARLSDQDRVYQPDVERAIADSADSTAGAPLAIEEITDVLVRNDGRLSGRVTLGDGAMTWTDILVIARIEGTWLIDDVIPVSR